MELQIERSFSFRFSPLSVFLLCGSICWFLLVRSERFTGVVISALVVHDGQSFPCKTVHVYFLAETGQEKKDMSRWARIIQHSIQHHGTIIIMVHLLGCTVSTSTERTPLRLFILKWMIATAYLQHGRPCIHFAWYSLPLFALLHCKNALLIFNVSYVSILPNLSIVIYCPFNNIHTMLPSTTVVYFSVCLGNRLW